MRYNRIMITSSKGGVGKSTVTANLGYTLARLGVRVLVVDLDLSNRSLDLLYGCENALIYDLEDAYSGKVPLRRVLKRLRRSKNLFFLPGVLNPTTYPSASQLEELLAEASRLIRPDVVLIDTSGSADGSAAIAARLCDCALIVSTPDRTSIRAAESSALLLREAGVPEMWLTVNRFSAPRPFGGRAAIADIIDQTGLSLLGVVPREEELRRAQEHGRLADEGRLRLNSAVAFYNIARRLLGESVPLFDGFRLIRLPGKAR